MVKRIKIIQMQTGGKIFSNLTPGSEHDVIDTPKEYINSKVKGVWVMGAGEPVKVLPYEFIFID